MGDVQRADHIADTFTDRLIKALVRASLRRCGNCVLRIECSINLIKGVEQDPIRAAALHLINNDLDRPTDSSIASSAAAHFLKSNCLAGCLNNRMPRCTGYWLDFAGCGDLKEGTIAALQDLAKLPEEELALRLEAVMRSLGLTSAGLITDASMLLLSCKATGRYRTACSEGVIVK